MDEKRTVKTDANQSNDAKRTASELRLQRPKTPAVGGLPAAEAEQAREAAAVAHLGSQSLSSGLGSPSLKHGLEQLIRGKSTPGDLVPPPAGRYDPAYGHPDTKYGPTLPNNDDQAPPALVTAPSSDPRDWAGGADGFYVPPDIKRSAVVWYSRDNEQNTMTYGLSNETMVVVGKDTRAVWRPRAGGGWQVIRYRRVGDELLETTREEVVAGSETPNPNERIPANKFEVPQKPDGQDSTLKPKDIDKTQDPSADGENTGAGRHYDHSAAAPAPEVTKVNPGPEGATPQLVAPRLRPQDLNTDPWRRENIGTAVDAARLRERLPGGIGPGGNPGDPDDPR